MEWLNSILRAITGRKKAAAAHTCKKGHTLDPDWEGPCPVCKAAENRESNKTARVRDTENDSLEESPRMRTVTDRSSDAWERASSPDGSAMRPHRGGTLVPNRDDVGLERGKSSGTRNPRVIGTLFTDTWDSRGKIIELYEGHNMIGRKPRASDPDPNQDKNYIEFPADETMSGLHAEIRRGASGRIELIDNRSLNGTLINGNAVEGNSSAVLKDGALITMGETVLEFTEVNRGKKRSGADGKPEQGSKDCGDNQAEDDRSPR